MMISILSNTDPRYPDLLKATDSAPKTLYYKGDLSLLNSPCLAVVGTRRCSERGASIAFRFAEVLAREGVTIVSGLAFGIDAAAHRGALHAPGKTIAVLAQALDSLSPAAHRDLAEEIVQKGGLLLSEYALGHVTFKSDYLLRNRLIAGLCRATLVVEAGHPSGALNTAKHAVNEGRDVFCIPGRLEDASSAGCLTLIKNGAHLATCPEDLSIPFGLNFKEKNVNSFLSKLTDFERELCVSIKRTPHTLPELAELFRHRSSELYEALSHLELTGVIQLSLDRRYRIVL